MSILLNVHETAIYFSGELWFDFLSRFFANCFASFVLIRYIFYPNNGQSKYLFIFFMTGLMIFLISSTLDQVTLNIGIALGLFAIFGIIRFRTPSVGLKEMTYLFLSIGMAVINALVEFNMANWFGLIIANSIILGSAYIMERYKPKTIIVKRNLVFSPANYQILNNSTLLMNEIKSATGIDVISAEITKINKVKNEVTAIISFKKSNEILLETTPVEEPDEGQHIIINYDWESSNSHSF